MFSMQPDQAHHVASRSFDANDSFDEFTNSLFSSSGAAVETEHCSERQMSRHGATNSFDANIPPQGTTGGLAYNNDSNINNINNNPIFMIPLPPARSVAGCTTDGVGLARQASHHRRSSSLFDANSIFPASWEHLSLQNRDQLQDMVLRTPRAPEPRHPSPLVRREQPWSQMPQSSNTTHDNGSINRIGGSSGGTSMDRYLHTPERRHTPPESNDKSSPPGRKRKRLPYRCK